MCKASFFTLNNPPFLILFLGLLYTIFTGVCRFILVTVTVTVDRDHDRNRGPHPTPTKQHTSPNHATCGKYTRPKQSEHASSWQVQTNLRFWDISPLAARLMKTTLSRGYKPAGDDEEEEEEAAEDEEEHQRAGKKL